MRARNIKPGFFKNEDLAECSPLARLLFAGLWLMADREGRLEDREKRIKAEILPYDNTDIHGLLEELHGFRFILRYEVHGKRFIQIANFTVHQYPHKSEKPSDIPELEQGTPTVSDRETKKNSTRTVQEQESNGSRPASILNPEYLNPESIKEYSVKSPDGESRVSVPKGYPEDFEKFWKTYPAYRRKEKPDALKAWKAACKQTTAEGLQAALERFCDTEEVAGGFAPYPAKWLKRERWSEDFNQQTPPDGKSPEQSRQNVAKAALKRLQERDEQEYQQMRGEDELRQNRG